MGFIFLIFQNLIGPSLLGTITKIIPLKYLKGLIEFAVIGLIIYGAYSWAYHNGVVAQRLKDAPTIAGLKADKKEAIAELDTFKASFADWKKRSELANKTLVEQNLQLQERLTVNIQKSKNLGIQKEKLQNEINQFISAKEDAACILPVGFVRLFNYANQAPTSSATDIFPLSPSTLDATPSGISLSQATNAIIANGNEAVQRGIIIEQWQTWYLETKEQFEQAQRKKAEAILSVESLK